MTGSTSESSPRAYSRSHGTRRSVLWADRLATWVIAVGGVGTIAAVLMVFVFLAWVVVPLFVAESMHPRPAVVLEESLASSPALASGVDEYLSIGWAFQADHTFRTFRIDTGEPLAELAPFAEGEPPSCWSFGIDGKHAIFGFADGTLRPAKLGYTSKYLRPDDIPAAIRDSLPVGETATFEDGVLERTPEGPFRKQVLSINLGEPLEATPGEPLRGVDRSVSTRGDIMAAISQAGTLVVLNSQSIDNLLTGERITRIREGRVAVEPTKQPAPAAHVKLTGLGDTVLLIWNSGEAQRYDIRNIRNPRWAETLDLLGIAATRVTAVDFLIGKTSLVIGDDAGRTSVWFGTKPEGAETIDGSRWVRAHEFRFPSADGESAAVAALAPSPRSRMLGMAVGRDVHLVNVTAGKHLAQGQLDALPEALLLAPKDNVLIGLAGQQLASWKIDAPHPEATWASLFLPVHYEGYTEPAHVWQSSSGMDAFEPKYGLEPLILGTLKATFYSMLFGAPLAVLAAIYTSEFLDPRIKGVIKPTVEVMASLPSVVLGFLAALVFAPWVERFVPELLSAFVTVPLALLLGAQLWQMIPSHFIRGFRLIGMVVALAVGLYAAAQLGWIVELLLFSGDIMAWLDGDVGDGLGGWLLLTLPLGALITMVVYGRSSTRIIRPLAAQTSRVGFGLIDLLRFSLGVLVTLAVAYGLAAVLTYGLQWDPRGAFLGTYIQRNAWVVGFMMGFAIIPIIYTISEDALSAVPESLRAGSLATGATRWQTAMRVVVPTAMSGMFSALMIGLGRAVGETMIVLMAAGNTPVRDWNLFNGFRTLSANIAVELPEAVQDSTHYRILFLAALTLFVMTFVVNTVAEIVRMHFRKRAFQL